MYEQSAKNKHFTLKILKSAHWTEDKGKIFTELRKGEKTVKHWGEKKFPTLTNIQLNGNIASSLYNNYEQYVSN